MLTKYGVLWLTLGGLAAVTVVAAAESRPSAECREAARRVCSTLTELSDCEEDAVELCIKFAEAEPKMIARPALDQ